MLCMIGWAFVDRSIWALVGGAICSAVVESYSQPCLVARYSQSLAVGQIGISGNLPFWQMDVLIVDTRISCKQRRSPAAGRINQFERTLEFIRLPLLSPIQSSKFRLKIMGDVSFPALSEVARDRPTDLKSSYYRFHAVIASFAYICSGVLMTSGDSLVHFLYDPRYAEAGWMLEILAVALLTVPFRLATQSFLALGRPQLFSTVIAIRLAVLFVATPIGFYYFGIPGALWGIVSSQFAYLPAIICTM